jgi:hypothetical protein
MKNDNQSGRAGARCKDGTNVFSRILRQPMSDFDKLVFDSEHGDEESGEKLIKMLEAQISNLKCWHKIPMNKTVDDIIKHDLEVNEYDGLFNRNSDCACEVTDLAPCGEISLDCQVGYYQKATKEQGFVIGTIAKINRRSKYEKSNDKTSQLCN